MPTYSSLLRFVEPTDGDLNWGGTVNTGFTELADAAIAGTATVDVTSGNVTLSVANGGDDQARKMVLNITGSPGAARDVIVPSTSKIYFVANTCGQTATVKVFGQTGVAVPNGASMLLRVNGTDAVQAVSNFASLNVNGEAVTTPTATQTLSNKTLSSVVINDGYTEEVYTLATSGSVALNPANGSIQTSTLSGNITFTDSLSAGQSIVLMLSGGSTYTVTWPTITWVSVPGTIAPVLTASDVLVFWKVGSTLYGSYTGSST